jgi:hypothetical protein
MSKLCKIVANTLTVLIVLAEFLGTAADDLKAALLPWPLACRDVPMDSALNVPTDCRTLLDCVDGEPDSLSDVCDSHGIRLEANADGLKLLVQVDHES